MLRLLRSARPNRLRKRWGLLPLLNRRDRPPLTAAMAHAMVQIWKYGRAMVQTNTWSSCRAKRLVEFLCTCRATDVVSQPLAHPAVHASPAARSARPHARCRLRSRACLAARMGVRGCLVAADARVRPTGACASVCGVAPPARQRRVNPSYLIV